MGSLGLELGVTKYKVDAKMSVYFQRISLTNRRVKITLRSRMVKYVHKLEFQLDIRFVRER